MTRCGDPDSARPGGASKFGDWLDPDADVAWRAANQEALDLGHTWVGTEHMLLGLLRLPADDPAAATLAVHGVTVDQFRDALSRDLGDAPRLDAKAMLAVLGVDLDAVRASVEANFGPDAVDALYARRRRDGPGWPADRCAAWLWRLAQSRRSRTPAALLRPTIALSPAPATCSPVCSLSRTGWRSGCCASSMSTPWRCATSCSRAPLADR
jgi:hypothetical protein